MGCMKKMLRIKKAVTRKKYGKARLGLMVYHADQRLGSFYQAQGP